MENFEHNDDTTSQEDDAYLKKYKEKILEVLDGENPSSYSGLFYKLPEQVKNSTEVQDAAKKAIMNNISLGLVDSSIKIAEIFSGSNRLELSPEVQDSARKGAELMLSKGRPETASMIVENFNLPDEILNSPENQNTIK